MIFNLKYLILPLSIVVCINNNCINAMEDINENQNKIIENNTKFQSKMSVNEMGQVMKSIINHEQLNNVQINFIQRLAYAVSSELPQDIKQLGQSIDNVFFDGWTFLGEVKDINEEFFDNLFILSYISQYDIHRCTNAVEREIGKIENHNCNGINPCDLGNCNKCNKNYTYFLNQIKKCYEQNYISEIQYTALLKFLLYYNTNRLFKIIIETNEYDEMILKNLKGQGKINLNTSNHPILDCMINHGHIGCTYWCSSIENIISPITKIMEQLIEILLPSRITLVDVNKLKEKIKTSVLELMAQGIYDATRKIYDESRQREYAKVFDINSKEFLKKIDTEFNITRKISESPKYKAYKKNYNQFINYYHGLRRKSKNDVDFNNALENETQYHSLKDVQNKIKANKLGIETNIKSNNENSTPLPGPVFETILPFLVHTKFDRKSNINNQTQHNQLQNNINEINTNNNDDEGGNVD